MVVRRDLPIGLLAAQIVHAAGESGPADAGTHAVVLTAPNEAALEAVSARLSAQGIAHMRIVENAPPYEGQLMAIGVPPARKEALRKHLSMLPLLR